MRAEIVPFLVDTSTGPLKGMHGEHQIMVIPAETNGSPDEEKGIELRGLPAYVYMHPRMHPHLDEESIIMLAGNVQVTWTVTEMEAMMDLMPTLIEAGRQNGKQLDEMP